MAKTVSLVMMRGGVGRSTLTVHLAHELTTHPAWRRSVLVVDLDPQGGASRYLLGSDRYSREIVATGRPTVGDFLAQVSQTPGVPPAPLPDSTQMVMRVVSCTGSRAHLDLLPSRFDLAASMDLPAERAHLLASFLATVGDRYDLILVDCPASGSSLITAAYLASDFILVPVMPNDVALLDIPALAQSLERFHRCQTQHRVAIAAVVFNQPTDFERDEPDARQRVLAATAELGWTVFSSEITYSPSHAKRSHDGVRVFGTRETETPKASAFHAVAAELAEAIGL